MYTICVFIKRNNNSSQLPLQTERYIGLHRYMYQQKVTDPSFITWYLIPHSPLPLWADTDPAVTTETDPATPACPPSPTHSAIPHSTSQLTDTTDSSTLFDSAESTTFAFSTPKESRQSDFRLSDDDINDIPDIPSFVSSCRPTSPFKSPT